MSYVSIFTHDFAIFNNLTFMITVLVRYILFITIICMIIV